MKNKVVVGILAHVDAGKTTLSEAMLYESGMTRSLGRVDKGDAFLDTDELERKRGITIYSKEAVMKLANLEVTLIDTPGHVDFAADMERTLHVLDYAILVISGTDGVQAHSLTLWKLLAHHKIPTFIFINKMDQPGTDRAAITEELIQRLDEGCMDFEKYKETGNQETMALHSEKLLEHFLERGELTNEEISCLIDKREIFPCFYGAALKEEGIEYFMQGMSTFMKAKPGGEEFGAQVYRISRDEEGNRITHMKITGGEVKPRMLLTYDGLDGETYGQKITQVRIYSGQKYETVDEAGVGSIVGVLGLSKTYPGLGLGIDHNASAPIIEPVLTYQVCLSDGIDEGIALPKFKELEEEEPELKVTWKEELHEIGVKVMGEVQLEVLASQIKARYGMEVTFGEGRIIYKETIAQPVYGVGHFEPLRHYAEVHLLMVPSKPESGITVETDCSEDILDKNWQRLITTHLLERSFVGVATGSELTDLKITIVNGRAHKKHTEGGDFRQATYRAVRQGLMQATMVILEPYYELMLQVPTKLMGRAMTDLDQMQAIMEAPMTEGEDTLLTGIIPVSNLRNYAQNVVAYLKGLGKLTVSLLGYRPCHNSEEVIASRGYNPISDIINSADSVFCSHGSGTIVPWNQVFKKMHCEQRYLNEIDKEDRPNKVRRTKELNLSIGTAEINEIMNRTFYANSKDKRAQFHNLKRVKKMKYTSTPEVTGAYVYRGSVPKEHYMLVDGYNVIFAWQELSDLAESNIDSARGRLADILCNYQATKDLHLILVFDAYRVQNHSTEICDYHNIHIVYTKEAETADAYIERFAVQKSHQYHVTVVTSDGLEQIIIRGAGASLISSREFKDEVEREKELVIQYLNESK